MPKIEVTLIFRVQIRKTGLTRDYLRYRIDELVNRAIEIRALEPNTMVMASIIYEKGAPDVFRWEAIDVPDPAPGEVRIKHSAIGVNYADTYHRRGMKHVIPLPELPLVLGLEGVGQVLEIGAGVTEFAVGDKVAYCKPPVGSYAEERNYPAETLVGVPEGVDDIALAGLMMSGLTAQMLLKQTYQVGEGDTVLIHAAAGGMGFVLCPWAKHLGATVIGTVGSAAKAEIAMGLGCDHIINYNNENFSTRVREITDGKGCDVVYESIGKTTLKQSLASLRPMGVCAAYGHASGEPDPIDIISDLGTPGALFITRPGLHWYLRDRAKLLIAADDLFAALSAGIINKTVGSTYPLNDVAEAHRAIEGRQTTGATVLIP